MAPTVLGIDSSTQATKAVLVDADTGEVLEERRASHPEGTEVDPRAWLTAVDEAADPLLERAEAVAVGGQQHGMVLLDEQGNVVRDAQIGRASCRERMKDRADGRAAKEDTTG